MCGTTHAGSGPAPDRARHRRQAVRRSAAPVLLRIAEIERDGVIYERAGVRAFGTSSRTVTWPTLLHSDVGRLSRRIDRSVENLRSPGAARPVSPNACTSCHCSRRYRWPCSLRRSDGRDGRWCCSARTSFPSVSGDVAALHPARLDALRAKGRVQELRRTREVSARNLRANIARIRSACGRKRVPAASRSADRKPGPPSPRRRRGNLACT